MKPIKTTVIHLLCFFLLTCGIDEYYYLPQLSENRIIRQVNTRAEIDIPPNMLDSVSFYYATGYVIFYKIYTSNDNNNNVDILRTFPRISSDYSGLFPYTDPTNATNIPSLNTFSSRGFYQLELENIDIKTTVLSKNGGTFIIEFPTRPGDSPYIRYNGNPYNLLRSRGTNVGESPFNPIPVDRYFIGSDDLKNFAYASQTSPTVNADVSGQSGIPANAFVSMYIVAVGSNPRNFNKLYGKPTHISIFKLPSDK